MLKALIFASLCAPVLTSAQTPAPAAEAAAKASESAAKVKTPAVRCQVSARLVEAHHEHGAKRKAEADQTDEEKEQLKTLPYGSFQTLAVQHADLGLGQAGSLELPQKDGEKFLVKVTPHSYADNKVHYTVEWTAPGEKSVVATRLGVENGRNIMLGTDTLEGESKKRCLVVGIRVQCASAAPIAAPPAGEQKK